MGLDCLAESAAAAFDQEGVFYFPGGQGKVPAVDPWDVAAVAAVALTESGHQGQAYALTGPEALSFGQMADVLARVLGKPVDYIDIPDKAVGEQMRKAGLPDYVIEGLIGTFAAVRAGLLDYCTGDVEKVTDRPPRSFEAWCRAHCLRFNK
jgi:uncharacterized protein YbjT (DUF2867 family)